MKANVLFILNDPPHGTERSYDGLRLAVSFSRRDNVYLRVFLMADAVGCGKSGQLTPNGHYNIERMLKSLASSKVEFGTVVLAWMPAE